MDPLDPIKAASHSNPYPYYATLRSRESQLEHDLALKLWVASKAGAVLEILHNPALVVRPPEQPVPKAVDHSAAGTIFGVMLGAASRDDALYVEAERFRLDRSEPAIVGFSSGKHQCPGEHIAQAIAAGAITYLLDSGMELSQHNIAWTYRPSPNARIPQFTTR